ncbi:MAG: YggS family pyridoxal phosphate-dependent enzyme [Lachnospiraceae bacterium]
MLIDNYNEVQNRVREACLRVNRDPDEVTLIAVSKTKPLTDIETLRAHGVLEYGENKVQELVDKYEHIQEPVHWHMIGHLQTNKVKYIIDKVCLIHSVDSLKLAQCINKEAEKHNVKIPVLLEVNVAGEESKFGFSVEGLYASIKEIAMLPNIQVDGLMTIAPFVEDSEENRVHFRKLKEILVDINRKNIDNITMHTLSMGMTGDYEVAIEEGATMVRVGTGIFGTRNYKK